MFPTVETERAARESPVRETEPAPRAATEWQPSGNRGASEGTLSGGQRGNPQRGEARESPAGASQAPPWQGLKSVAAILAGALVFFGIVTLAYELAVARVPQHRAALESLVRAQTGLDIRFEDMGLRWGWYGPEAVFHGVELGEPGRSTVLLKAPELVVGFDVWQTLRSGQLEAGRITLVAADIDFRRGGGRAGAVGAASLPAARAGPAVEAAKVLEGWRGGRVDLEGGILRLPDPSGSATALTLQVRRASLRRATSEWSGYGLVYLPERLGRTARLGLRLDGDLEHPEALSGTLRFEGHRLVLAGWRDVLASMPAAARYLPRAGGGEVALDVDFARGRVTKANGKVSAVGLEFAAADDPSGTVVSLDHLKGEWRVAQRDFGWRLQVDSLELADPATLGAPARFSLDAAPASGWIRGHLEQAPVPSVAAIIRWFAPQLDLSSVGLGGTVRDLTFDWNEARPHGRRLRTAARLSGMEVAPPSQGFTLKGLAGHIAGDETDLVAELGTSTGQLELAQAPKYPLDEVHVAARLQIHCSANDWRIRTEELELRHQDTRLKIDGVLAGADAGSVPFGGAPEIDARAELTGVDLPLLERLAGSGLPRTVAVFSQLTQGQIDRVRMELRGPFDSMGPRVHAAIEGARLQAVAGIPPMDELRGSLVFDGGSLRRSTFTGTWLGGPVTLSVGERHEHGGSVLAIQGRGVLDARQLSLAATAGTVIDETRAPTGRSAWSGELTYVTGDDSKPAQWRVRADSSLIGVVSHLPQPLRKTPSAAVPLHLEAQGNAAAAVFRFNLGERLRSLLALKRRADATWQVERGNVQFGPGVAVLPESPVVLVEGGLSQLDLPAYVAAWQQLRAEPGAPAIRANLLAGELLVAGHRYAGVQVLAERTEAGADLHLRSAQMTGIAHWPARTDAGHPATFHFVRLDVPDGGAFGASAELIAALGPATELSVDDLVWQGRSIGSAAATIQSGGNVVDVTDLRLSGSTQEVQGSMHCQNTSCRLKFNLDSNDAAATLEDFGFRPELTASKATLDGDLQWQAGTEQPALATLAGRLNMQLEDGTTVAEPGSSQDAGSPFALLLVPALVSGMGSPTATTGSLPDAHALRFSRLDADFDVHDGEAATSNLHFDGDAEILMRGRTNLVARSYDQQVWVLRGEGRLPAAVRRLGPTPRVAAAWLSLRELFAGGTREEGSKAPLHLQGSWDNPIVVAADGDPQ